MKIFILFSYRLDLPEDHFSCIFWALLEQRSTKACRSLVSLLCSMSMTPKLNTCKLTVDLSCRAAIDMQFAYLLLITLASSGFNFTFELHFQQQRGKRKGRMDPKILILIPPLMHLKRREQNIWQRQPLLALLRCYHPQIRLEGCSYNFSIFHFTHLLLPYRLRWPRGLPYTQK